MNLKTYTANSMAEALALVKSELGADGVILHTRTFKRGGIMGIGARNIVEVTAAKGKDIGRQRRRSAGKMPARPASKKPTTVEPVSETAGDLIKRTYAAARAELEKTQLAAAPAEMNGMATEAVATLTPPVMVATSTQSDQLAAEMRAVKQMVGRMMHQQKGKPADLPDNLFEQYLSLLEQEVADELATEIIEAVHQRLECEGQVDDAEACRAAMLEAVAKLLPTEPGDDEASPRQHDGRPHTIALVGPTGVGKTTTIAKLAATFKLKQNKSVGLITVDTYRIAAVDQLRTYAAIIGVPLRVVSDPAGMREAMATCGDCDIVLIDTAGRAPRDTTKLGELSALLAAADPDEVHLVLASTCTQGVLLEAAERFNPIRTDGIIFTKLDEAVTLGVLLNVAKKVNKRLSYITTGQEVPHQIEPGRSDRLASLVLGESVVGP